MFVDPKDIGTSEIRKKFDDFVNYENSLKNALAKNNLEENQFWLVNRSPNFLEDIPNPTPNVQLQVISLYPSMIWAIKRPTNQVQEIAVTHNPNNLIDIRYPNKKLLARYFDHPELTFPCAQHIYQVTNQIHIKAYLLMRWNKSHEDMNRYIVNDDF